MIWVASFISLAAGIALGFILTIASLDEPKADEFEEPPTDL